MSNEPEIEPGFCPAAYLDPKRAGEILLRVIPASAAAGHQYPAGTLKDYCRPAGGEMELVTGMLSMSAPELAERWYGGIPSASRIACFAQARSWPAS